MFVQALAALESKDTDASLWSLSDYCRRTVKPLIAPQEPLVIINKTNIACSHSLLQISFYNSFHFVYLQIDTPDMNMLPEEVVGVPGTHAAEVDQVQDLNDDETGDINLCVIKQRFTQVSIIKNGRSYEDVVITRRLNIMWTSQHQRNILCSNHPM